MGHIANVHKVHNHLSWFDLKLSPTLGEGDCHSLSGRTTRQSSIDRWAGYVDNCGLAGSPFRQILQAPEAQGRNTQCEHPERKKIRGS